MLKRILGWQHLPLALLGVALAVTLVLARIAVSQRDDARALADSRQVTITSLQDRVRSDGVLIAQRDQLIAKQNAGIASLAAAANAGRTVYLTTYAKADERAKDHDGHAAELLALTDTHTDELAQCRASKVLMEQELGL